MFGFGVETCTSNYARPKKLRETRNCVSQESRGVNKKENQGMEEMEMRKAKAMKRLVGNAITWVEVPLIVSMIMSSSLIWLRCCAYDKRHTLTMDIQYASTIVSNTIVF